jgi:hypothetical protein
MENLRSPYTDESLMKLKLIRWPNNQPFPSREDLEKAMIKEGLAPFRMVDPPCTYYHGRVLSRPEVCWVLEGRLLVGMEDQEILLDIGDRIELPQGVKHWIRVISENGAAYLIASLPN